MKTVAFFNNKGGVGNTLLVYHLAWMFSEMGKRVVVADFDPQANLTSMFFSDRELEKLWNPDLARNPTTMAALEPVIRGIGDIAKAPIREVAPNVALIPGDLNLSVFEAELADAWNQCLDKSGRAFRTTSSLSRISSQAAEDFEADLVLIDTGPNFSAINRAALIGANAVMIPLAPDVFAMQTLKTVGAVLEKWRNEWCERVKDVPETDLPLPQAIMSPLGYVILQFGIPANKPLKGYETWANRIPLAFRESILGESGDKPISLDSDPYCMGKLNPYRSLMPMAMESRKPLFYLKPADGAFGSHTRSVMTAEAEFRKLASDILKRLELLEE